VAERTSSGGGGVQNVGYNSHVLSPVGCTRQTGPDLYACSACCRRLQVTRTQGIRVCCRRFGAFQGRSGRVFTHQSVSLVPGPPEATSAQHVALSIYVVAHQSRTGVTRLPEPTSVQNVVATSQGVTRQLSCRGLVAESALRLRTWLTSDQDQCCQACRGSGVLLTQPGLSTVIHGRPLPPAPPCPHQRHA